MSKLTVKKSRDIIRDTGATITEGLAYSGKRVNWSNDKVSSCCAEGIVMIAEKLKDGASVESLEGAHYGPKYSSMIHYAAKYNAKMFGSSLTTAIDWIDGCDLDSKYKLNVLEILLNTKGAIKASKHEWKNKHSIVGAHKWAKDLNKLSFTQISFN